MPKEWHLLEEEDADRILVSLREDIHTLAGCGRNAEMRLNVRELIAPLAFLGASRVLENELNTMLSEIFRAKEHLSLLFEKLSLLRAELYPKGGDACA